MPIKKDAERISMGNELTQVENKIDALFGQLDNLNNLLGKAKNKMQNDPTTYTPADVAEVDALITKISDKYTP